jgi:hypothetical protein
VICQGSRVFIFITLIIDHEDSMFEGFHKILGAMAFIPPVKIRIPLWEDGMMKSLGNRG